MTKQIQKNNLTLNIEKNDYSKRGLFIIRKRD